MSLDQKVRVDLIKEQEPEVKMTKEETLKGVLTAMKLELAMTEKLSGMRNKVQPKIYQEMMAIERARISDALLVNLGADQT